MAAASAPGMPANEADHRDDLLFDFDRLDDLEASARCRAPPAEAVALPQGARGERSCSGAAAAPEPGGPGAGVGEGGSGERQSAGAAAAPESAEEGALPAARPAGSLAAAGAPAAEEGAPASGSAAAPPGAALCTDAGGGARGRCRACGQCGSFALPRRACLRWAGDPGSSDEEGAAGPPAREEEPCELCGCPASSHADLRAWVAEVVAHMRRFRNTGRNTKRRLPRRGWLPATACAWPPADAALFALTLGVFDPQAHGRHEESSEAGALVSVVCPTSESRQAFHPLLYECFRTQSYEPKELVVIDTGTRPSAFLLGRAAEDPRVVYRHFPVQDARTQDLQDCLWDPPADPWAAGWPLAAAPRGGGAARRRQLGAPRAPAAAPLQVQRFRGGVRGGVRREGWTLGLKRNLACHLARGGIIAHFDDDDLYAPCYLGVMVEKLMQAVRPRLAPACRPADVAAAATLADWHVIDLADETFGFVSPRTDPLLPTDMREAFVYGFGFSYVYTRAAWALEPFADVEWSEDGNFTAELVRRGKPVVLVKTPLVRGVPDALAAHSHHWDTTSGGEFVDVQCRDGSGYGLRQVSRAVRMGSKCAPPEPLVPLLDMARAAVAGMDLRRGEVHPLRRQLAERPVAKEVGLVEKAAFLQTPLGRSLVADPGTRSGRDLGWRRALPPGARGPGAGFRFP